MNGEIDRTLHIFFRKKLKKKNRPVVKGIVYGIEQRIGLNINTSNYWNSVWNKEGLNSWREYTILFETLFSLVPENSRVLNVGCGVEKLLKLLQDGKNVDAYGLDRSREAIKLLTSKGIQLVVSTLPTIPFSDDFFDVVIATEIREHLSSPEYTLKEIYRVLKTNGLLIISVPNNCLGPGECREHLRKYTIKSFKNDLDFLKSEIKIDNVRDFDCDHLLSICKK